MAALCRLIRAAQVCVLAQSLLCVLCSAQSIATFVDVVRSVDAQLPLAQQPIVLNLSAAVLTANQPIQIDFTSTNSTGTRDVTIIGQGADRTVWDCNNAVPALSILGARTVTLTQLSIRNCRRTEAQGGGALRVSAKAVNIANCAFSGNSASNTTANWGTLGGAVYISDAQTTTTVNISSCVFTGNQAPQGGAGIGIGNLTDVEATIFNCTFQGNSAGYGAGVYVEREQGTGAVYLLNNTFTDNTCTKDAAGFYFWQYGDEKPPVTYVVDGCKFQGGRVDRWAGAGYIDHIRGNVRISRSTFYNNSAKQATGSVMLDRFTDVDVVFDDNTFSQNNADGCAGALCVKGTSTVTVSNSRFINNTCGQEGAAVSGANLRSLTVLASAFQGNAGTQGGGIRVQESGPVVLNASMFTSNTAQQGGGLNWHQQSGPVSINSCTFNGNTARASGGALAATDSSGRLFIRDSTFSQDRAVEDGAVIYTSGLTADVTIINTDIQSNATGANVCLLASRASSALWVLASTSVQPLGLQKFNGCLSQVETYGTGPVPAAVLPPPMPTVLQPPPQPPAATAGPSATPASGPPQGLPPPAPNRSAATTPATEVGSSPDSQQKKTPVAAIAGGAAAGGVLLVVLIGLAVCFSRRRARRAAEDAVSVPIYSQESSDAATTQGGTGKNITQSTGTGNQGSESQTKTAMHSTLASHASTAHTAVTVSSSKSEDYAAYQREVLSRLHIPWSSIVLGKVLGHGGFGTVYKGVWKDLSVAVKMLNVESLSSDARAALRQEALAMCELRHPAIAHIYGLVDDGEHCALVMKYYRHGALSAAIADGQYQDLGLVQRVKMALQVASGMSALHERGFIHGDLKTSNLLVEVDGSVVITDFGLAVMAGERVASGAMTVQISPPELLRNPGAPRTKAGDVYAFSIVLLEVITGRFAYVGMQRDMIRRAVSAGQRPPVPAGVPSGIVEIISACWAQEAGNRPSFEDVMSQLVSVLREVDTRASSVARSQTSGVHYSTLYDTTHAMTTTTAAWPFRE